MGLKEVVDVKTFTKLSKLQVQAIKEISSHIDQVRNFVDAMLEERKAANRLDSTVDKAIA